VKDRITSSLCCGSTNGANPIRIKIYTAAIYFVILKYILYSCNFRKAANIKAPPAAAIKMA
jgi:hypothetical protein